MCPGPSAPGGRPWFDTAVLQHILSVILSPSFRQDGSEVEVGLESGVGQCNVHASARRHGSELTCRTVYRTKARLDGSRVLIADWGKSRSDG